MVKLHIKRGDDTILLYETTVDISILELIAQLVRLYNGVLKVQRLCQGKLASYIFTSCRLKSKGVAQCVSDFTHKFHCGRLG